MATASLVLTTVCAVGCGASLSTFQTARVPDRGHASASLGFEGSLPVGSLMDVVGTAKDLGAAASRGQRLTSDEQWHMLEAGLQLVLSPPSFSSHAMAAYVPWDRVELSLRYAGSAFRLGSRYQVLRREEGPFDMSVGLGISRFTLGLGLLDLIPVLEIDDFTRWQIDAPVLIGTQNRWIRTWVGPRLVATFFDAGIKLQFQSQAPVLAAMSGHAYFVGAQGGFGFGYRWLFVAFELTMTQMFGSAGVSAPAIVDMPHRDVHLSGLVIYPSIGLMGEF